MQEKTKKISLLNKFIIVMLVITITMTNFLIVGKSLVTYAAEALLDNQTEATISKNVKFDTYFESDNGNTHYLISDVNASNANMKVKLDVTAGYLKDAKIEIQDANYEINNIVDTLGKVQSASEKQINLRQINSGENIELVFAIGTKTANNMELANVSKDSKVILRAIYVDEKGNEIELEKEIIVNVSWTGTFENEINMELAKYTNFVQNGEEKVLVQVLATSGLKDTQNKLPIKENNIEVSIPNLAGAKPEQVIVFAKSTMATNGKEEGNTILPEENVIKDLENGTVKIKIENKEENGKVWADEGNDEILLTYIYNKKDITEEIKAIALKGSSEMSIYSGNGINTVKNEITSEFDLTNLKGSIISINLDTDIEEISKGKMYANSVIQNKQYETIVETKSLVEVSYKDIVSEIKIDDTDTYFTDENGNKYLLGGNIYYKSTKISKENFEKILGTDGEIKILDENGNVITLINNSLQANENGDYVIEYASKYSKLSFITTKPVSEGELCITNQRAISKELVSSKDQISMFKNIVTQMKVDLKEMDSYITIESKEIIIPLAETVTSANISLSTNVLSTVVNNEDIEIKLELNNAVETSDLYIDGTFKIEFPEYVEDVTVKNSNILYSEGLNIKEITKQIENGKVVLYVTLEGIQSQFSTGTVTNGTNIILGTDIKTKLLTPSSENVIKLYYQNKNAVSYEQIDESTRMGYNETPVSFVSPTGMLAVNKISDYEETGKSIISVNQGTVVDKIEMDSEAIEAKMDLMLINNTGSVCNSLRVLGRIPFEGNKKVGTDEDLQTTVNTNMIQGLSIDEKYAQNAKIYYSENGEATDDLADANNLWTENPADFSKVKSYLVVLENYEFKQGETINMTYDFRVPEMIDLNNFLYGSFGATYEKTSEFGVQEETAVADVVGLTTGTGPVMEINQTVSVGENGVIQEGQIVKYTFSIKNAGNTDIENLKVKYLLPDYSVYGEFVEPGSMGPQESVFMEIETQVDEETGKNYTEFDIGTVAPGETVEKELLVKFNELPSIADYYADQEGFFYDETSGKYYILVQNPDGTYTETEVTSVPDVYAVSTLKITATDLELKTVEGKPNKVEKVVLLVSEKSSKAENVALKENENLTYTISIKNNTDKKLEEVVLEKVLPQGLNFSKVYAEEYDEQEEVYKPAIEGTYNEGTRLVSLTIPELEAGDMKEVKIEVTAASLAQDEYSKTITSSSTVYAKDVSKHVTTEVKNLVAKPKLAIEQTDTANGEYVSEREEITFILTIKNEGQISTEKIKIESKISEYFIPTNINYGIDNEEKTNISAGSNNILLEKVIEPGQTLTLNVTVNAVDLPNTLDEITVENVFTLTGDLIGELKSNTVVKTIEQSPEPNDPGDNTPEEPDNPEGPDDPIIPEIKTYKIKGTAWLDENSNGARETNEKLFSGIRVILLNAKTGDIIVDRTTGKAKETTTLENGTYEFDNLVQGEYIVVFYHDSSIYGLTEYAKPGVDSNINSDVILTKIMDNGEEKTAAVTNTIVIDEKSISNIDIGLVTNKKADLKLDKYVSLITVQNKDGVKTYNYTDTTLAKVEISAKRMSGSVVIVEYIMVVTNEGNIPMYAKNIVDYMPKDMKFNSDLNPNWYAGNDGNLYNNELSNTVINPGESKNIKLILTKTMTENNTGLSNNRAEIYEAYNELGIADIDSVPANQAEGEDDLGTANVFVTVKTGEEVTYICTILVALVIFVTGVYFIRRKTSRYYN